MYLGNGTQIVARFYLVTSPILLEMYIIEYFRELAVLYVYSSLAETSQDLKRKFHFQANAIEALSRADSQVSMMC